MERVQVMAIAVLLAAGTPFSVGHAQNGAAPAAAAQPQAPAQTQNQETLDQYTAGALVRLALMDLRALDDPKPRDYAMAVALLNAAQTLDPKNAEIARRRSEAAWNASDQDTLLAATRTLVELDPKDTVAQLRLITAQIGRMQTSEQRLSAYERALGPGGAGLDPSIRSRLALDAGLLMREKGDEDGYVQRIKMAAQLDATNKEAAYLALEAYKQRVGGMMGRVELLSNLLMSDPMDPHVMLELRDTFAVGGAYQAASRFHGIATNIMRAAGVGDDSQLDLVTLVLQWRLQGARPALNALLEQLEAARRDADEAAQQPGNLGMAGREDVRLSLTFEEVRIGASLVLGDDAELSRSFTDLSKSVKAQVAKLRDRGHRPANVTDEQVEQRVGEFNAGMESWRLLIATLAPGGLQPPPPTQWEMTVDPEVPAADAAPAAPDTPSTEAPPTGPVMEAWRAIVAGEAAKADALFDEAENQDDLWVMLGRAVALEKQVRDPEAARAYAEVARAAPLTVVGAIASAREAEMNSRIGSARQQPAVDPAALESFARTIPAWIDVMVERPWNYETLRAELVTTKASPLDRVQIRVKLRNLSPIPVGLGAGRPINTRLLFIPGMEAAGRIQVPDSEVIEVNRRLRLMPGEYVECIVWPEVGMSGYAAEQACTFPARSSWRVVQGFEAQNGGLPVPGPGCVEVRTESVLHEPLPEATLPVEELAARIGAADEARMGAVLIAARVTMAKGDAPATGRIAEAIVQRYPQWSPHVRMLALAALPPSSKVAALKALDALAAKEQDADVLLVAAVARAQAADDPILTAAAAMAASTSNAALAGVVSAQQERMKDGIKTYSQIGVRDAAPVAAAPPAAPAPVAPPVAPPAAPAGPTSAPGTPDQSKPAQPAPPTNQAPPATPGAPSQPGASPKR